MKNKIRKRIHELKDDNMTGEQWANYIDSIAYALGWFIIEFNDLDTTITTEICLLSAHGSNHNTDITLALVGTKTFSQKIKDLEMVLGLRINSKPNKEELLKQAKKLLNSITELNAERNKLVHADWYLTEQEGPDTLISTKAGIDDSGFYNDFFKCTPEQIEQLEDRCADVVEELEIFSAELRGQKPE
jgi:hypothetical protein